MASQTEENYLKSVLLLTSQREEVNVSELSSLLKVSLPTVNSMVNKLKKQSLLNYQKYKPLSLTDKGKLLALSILRKHRLAEMYLSEKMGFGWEEVHEIAEQLEHIDSEVFFDRMDELLGYPTIDPHGSPIPDKNGKINQTSYERLSSCKPGEAVKVVALSNDSSEFLKYLNKRELQLGIELEIKAAEIYDKSMIVSYKNHPSETLSENVCDDLFIEHITK